MKGQPPGLSQYQLTQQSNYEDMQLWQQQMMYKQHLQEFQRQQIQQLGQESQQQTFISHIPPAVTRHSTINQQQVPVNGMPLHGATFSSWSDEYTRNNQKISYGSQMVAAGSASLTPTIGPSNINGFSNGPMLSPDQCQTVQSIGIAPQQIEQSLYGLPVSSVGNSSNQFSQFHGLSQDSSETFSGSVPNRPTSLMAQSAFNSFQGNRVAYLNQNFMQNNSPLISKQDAQGKLISGRITSSAMTDSCGNFQQMNPLGTNLQVQESHVRDDQTDIQGKFQEKEAPRATIYSSTGLDPTEQKILFSSDDDTDWISSLGMGGNTSSSGHVSKIPSESPDPFSSFSSFHSGSWSALMQSAVAEVSSSDAGIQDDWRGMGSQKLDLHNQDNVISSDTRQIPFSGNKLHNPSSLTLEPNSLGNYDSNAGNSKASSFQQQSSKFINDLERVHVDTSHANNRNKFQDNFYQKDDTQSGQVYERPALDTKPIENAGLSLSNLESSSAHKQSSPLYMSTSQFNGSRYGNNASGFQLPSIEISSKASASENMRRPDQSSSNFQHLNAEGNYGIGMQNTDPNQLGAVSRMQSAALDSNLSKQNEDMNQLHHHNFEHGQHVFAKASENVGDRHQLPNKGLQVWGSLTSNPYRAPVDISDKKQVYGSQGELCNESVRLNHPNVDNCSDTGFVAGGANDSQTLVSGNKKAEQLTGNQTSNLQRLRGHQLENFGMISGLNNTQKQMLYAQMMFRGSKMHSQELSKHVPNNSLDVDMSRGTNSQGNARNSSDIHVRGCGSISNNNNNQDSRVTTPFDKPTTALPQSSQNVVPLLHKVDQSRSNDTISGFGVTQPLASNSNAPMVSGAFATNLRHVPNSSMQGYGLRLAPPSQLPPIPNKVHSYGGTVQANFDRIPENRGPEVENKQITWPNSSVHFLSTAPSQEASKSNIFDTKTSMHGNSSAAPPASPSYTRNQLHLAQIGGPVAQISIQKETDSQKTPNGSCRSEADGTPQPSLPDIPNRFQSFRMTSSAGLIDCQSLPIDSSPYVKNSGHFSISDSQGFMQSPHLVRTSQHGMFSGTSHNVWSTQHPATNLPDKGFPLQATSPKCVDATSTVLSETANLDTDTGEGSQHVELANISGNLENQLHAEEDTESGSSFRQQPPSENAKFSSQTTSVSQEQEPLRSQASEGNSFPSTVNEIDEGKGKNGHSVSEQKLDQPLMNVSSNREIHGLNFKQTISPGHHYSLLQQMHAMKALEAKSSNLLDRRIKVIDNSMDPKQLIGKAPQSHNVVFGNKLMGKSAADGELSAVVQQNLFPSDSKMLTFSSVGTNSQALGNSRQNDIQINSSTPISSSAFSTVGGTESRRISPQMAPSWFGHYGTPRVGNAAAMHSESESSQKNLKVAAEHHLIANSSGNIGPVIVSARNDDTDQNGYPGQAIVATIRANDKSLSVQTVSSDICEQNLLPKTKKRKSVELLPWRKEITQGSNRLQSIRTARMDWAQATNRLFEKVEDEFGMRDDASKSQRIRRRLLMTTQLMQELMPLVPARLLIEPSASSYEKVIYLMAKRGLGDACGLLSYLGEARRLPSEDGSSISGKLKISEKWIDQRFVKVLDNFFGRSKKLESDLLRLEKKASLLDIRVECQDLERFSIINRFAKFHGGSQLSVGLESSSTPESSHKVFPQRYVTALNIPGNNLEGVVCLSL